MRFKRESVLKLLVVLMAAVIIVMTAFIILVVRRQNAPAQEGTVSAPVTSAPSEGTPSAAVSPEPSDTVSETEEDIPLWDWNNYPGGSPFEIREGEDTYPYSVYWRGRGYYGRNIDAGWLCGYDMMLEALHCTSEFMDTYVTPDIVEIAQDADHLEGPIELALVSVPKTTGTVVSFYVTANVYPREEAEEQFIYYFTFDKTDAHDTITFAKKKDVESLPEEERYIFTIKDQELAEVELEEGETFYSGYTEAEQKTVLNDLF